MILFSLISWFNVLNHTQESIVGVSSSKTKGVKVLVGRVSFVEFFSQSRGELNIVWGALVFCSIKCVLHFISFHYQIKVRLVKIRILIRMKRSLQNWIENHKILWYMKMSYEWVKTPYQRLRITFLAQFITIKWMGMHLKRSSLHFRPLNTYK